MLVGAPGLGLYPSEESLLPRQATYVPHGAWPSRDWCHLALLWSYPLLRKMGAEGAFKQGPRPLAPRSCAMQVPGPQAWVSEPWVTSSLSSSGLGGLWSQALHVLIKTFIFTATPLVGFPM